LSFSIIHFKKRNDGEFLLLKKEAPKSIITQLSEPGIKHCGYPLEVPESIKVSRRIFEGVVAQYRVWPNEATLPF